MSKDTQNHRYLIRSQTKTEIGIVPVLGRIVRIKDYGTSCKVIIDSDVITYEGNLFSSVEVIHEGKTIARWEPTPAAETQTPKTDGPIVITGKYRQIEINGRTYLVSSDGLISKNPEAYEQMIERLKGEMEKIAEESCLTVIHQMISPGGLLHSFMRNR